MHYAVGGFKFAKYKTWFNQTFMLAYDDFSTSTYLIVYKDVPINMELNMYVMKGINAFVLPSSPSKRPSVPMG